jgi:DNA-binding MarR family transcriptional regulator/N-acetylglutamate synthase-like GNAT family acetyltransferase
MIARVNFLVKLMSQNQINQVRQLSRKLVRELGILQLNNNQARKTPSHWHALIEIAKEPDITISKLGQLLLLSTSATSRIVNALLKDELVKFGDSLDKREKYIFLTDEGKKVIENIDEFSNIRVKGAFEFLTQTEQEEIIQAMQKYANALEKSRVLREQVKILTLSTSRAIRKQIVTMIEKIQIQEFSLVIPANVNAGVIKAEDEYYYNNSYNFWYAVDDQGKVIGCIGLKKLDNNHAEIKKFFVDSTYRGKGVAQKLMMTLMKAAIKHNFNIIYLGTVNILQAAQRFYEKYGFVRINKQQLPKEFVLCPLDTEFFQGKVEVVHDRLTQGLK